MNKDNNQDEFTRECDECSNKYERNYHNLREVEISYVEWGFYENGDILSFQTDDHSIMKYFHENKDNLEQAKEELLKKEKRKYERSLFHATDSYEKDLIQMLRFRNSTLIERDYALFKRDHFTKPTDTILSLSHEDRLEYYQLEYYKWNVLYAEKDLNLKMITMSLFISANQIGDFSWGEGLREEKAYERELESMKEKRTIETALQHFILSQDEYDAMYEHIRNMKNEVPDTLDSPKKR